MSPGQVMGILVLLLAVTWGWYGVLVWREERQERLRLARERKEQTIA